MAQMSNAERDSETWRPGRHAKKPSRHAKKERSLAVERPKIDGQSEHAGKRLPPITLRVVYALRLKLQLFTGESNWQRSQHDMLDQAAKT